MIYLQEGNFPLNEAFSSEIIQEANSTYQLTFKFPTSDPKWALLTPETELVADDLHGEQYFTIFEVEKQHGYVTVYANQVATLLNGYSINKINVDRVNGSTVMNALVAGFKRETPFTFFSDVMSKHTLNLKDISAMEALAKDKHSIVGQWGGDLVRDKYSVRLLEHGGIENESLFAYKKNMKSFQESKSTKELRTRIHFKKVIEAHEEGKKDQILTVTIDSPLINKYKHIYEADMEVQDQDVVDQKTLEEYGKRYFRETLCDMIEESLEIDVVGQADQPVHIFDIVSLFHEVYDVDLRKKITKYKFNPMSIKLVSIGFGEVTRTLADSISGMVNDSVDKKMKSYDAEYEAKVQKLVDNANAEYDKQAKELEHKITDGIEQAKAQAEVVKQEISAQVTDKIYAANQANKNEIVEEFKAQYNGIEVKMQGLKATTDQLKTSDVDIQKLINDFKAQTQSQFSGMQGAQSRFEQTTEKAISDLTNVTNGKADRSYVEQTVAGVKEEFTTIGVGGGPNMLRNSRADDGLNYWTEANGRLKFISHHFYLNGQKRMFYLSSGAVVKSSRFIFKKNADYVFNLLAFDANTARFKITFCKRKKDSTNDYDEVQTIFDKTGSPTFSSHKTLKRTFKFNTGDFDNGYLSFEYTGNPNGWSGIFMTELDFYEGENDRKWQPAPEDQNYLVEQAQANFEKTVQGLSTQLTKLETKTGPNGELEQRMLSYSEKAAVDVVKATRQILEQGYVAKSQYTEDVAGITRRLEDLKQNNNQVISSKIAEYKQTVDGQFTTITNQMGDMLRKTDIQITSGQILFGTGKTINGRTISSLLVQEPESIALIAQLIKVKGDMVVDGSIASRHLASQSVRTGHMESGSVTTQILASNAVTADKLLVDSAMINKLVSNQAFIRDLTSQKAFITQLTSIDFSAERISGGRILSNKGAMKIDLDNSEIDFNENARIEFKSGKNVLFRQRTHPQKKHNTIGALMFKDSVHGGVATTLGNTSHKWISEMTDNPSDAGADGSFAGIRIFRDSRETPYDRVELVGDRIQFRHSVRQNGGLQFQTTGFTVPSHGESGHAGAWNLGVLLEHFRQNFEIIRKKNPSWGLNIYSFPFYNINSDQTIPFDHYI
jgi:phage minor structural protein